MTSDYFSSILSIFIVATIVRLLIGDFFEIFEENNKGNRQAGGLIKTLIDSVLVVGTVMFYILLYSQNRDFFYKVIISGGILLLFAIVGYILLIRNNQNLEFTLSDIKFKKRLYDKNEINRIEENNRNKILLELSELKSSLQKLEKRIITYESKRSKRVKRKK